MVVDRVVVVDALMDTSVVVGRRSGGWMLWWWWWNQGVIVVYPSPNTLGSNAKDISNIIKVIIEVESPGHNL